MRVQLELQLRRNCTEGDTENHAKTCIKQSAERHV